MSRYMDVDELYKIFVNLCKDLDRVYEVDAVEVVRCKDCKWYHEIGCAIEIVDESDEPAQSFRY